MIRWLGYWTILTEPLSLGMYGSGSISNLDEALRCLYQLRRSGVKLGLENMQALCGRLDHPEQAYPVLHIAGTNGKGSVAAALDSVLCAAGFRVGCFTSPHLRRLNERFRVGRCAIWDEALIQQVCRLADHLKGCHHEGVEVTFFEACTALAFQWFRDEAVDVAIIETGLGGRLDSTNVVSPLCSIITSIGMDHQEYLGDSLTRIAWEKAGILKPGRPVVLGHLLAEAREVITARATELNCPVFAANSVQTLGIDRDRWTQDIRVGEERKTINLLGPHQSENVAIVLRVVEVLREYGWKISLTAVDTGLGQIDWPARFQRVSARPLIVLDGAHNASAWETLEITWNMVSSRPPDILGVGLLRSKWNPECIEKIRRLVGPGTEVWAGSIPGEDSVTPDEICSAIGGVRKRHLNSASEWKESLREVSGETEVLIAGSLYLAGALLACWEEHALGNGAD